CNLADTVYAIVLAHPKSTIESGDHVSNGVGSVTNFERTLPSCKVVFYWVIGVVEFIDVVSTPKETIKGFETCSRHTKIVPRTAIEAPSVNLFALCNEHTAIKWVQV